MLSWIGRSLLFYTDSMVVCVIPCLSILILSFSSSSFLVVYPHYLSIVPLLLIFLNGPYNVLVVNPDP